MLLTSLTASKRNEVKINFHSVLIILSPFNNHSIFIYFNFSPAKARRRHSDITTARTKNNRPYRSPQPACYKARWQCNVTLDADYLLEKFGPQVVHVKGETNVVADALSRLDMELREYDTIEEADDVRPQLSYVSKKESE